MPLPIHKAAARSARPSGARSRLPRLTNLPLGVEITLLLVIKISLITVLAKTFFAEPQAKHMRMPTASVEQHLLSSSTTPPPSFAAPVVSSPTPEVSHASDR